jgi:DNA polymerase III gamma/tau subunit
MISKGSLLKTFRDILEILLRKKISNEDDALYLIAQKADGALRDALSIFDRLSTFSQKYYPGKSC